MVLGPERNFKKKDKKLLFGGLSGHGKSCMNFLQFKKIKLCAFLHISVGFVKPKAQNDKTNLDIVMLHLESASFLDHVTGLVFCDFC